jgi:hypothetical protein
MFELALARAALARVAEKEKGQTRRFVRHLRSLQGKLRPDTKEEIYKRFAKNVDLDDC